MKTEQFLKEDGSRTQLASMSEKTHTPADPLSLPASGLLRTDEVFKRATAPAALRAAGWGGTTCILSQLADMPQPWQRLIGPPLTFTPRLRWLQPVKG